MRGALVAKVMPPRPTDVWPRPRLVRKLDEMRRTCAVSWIVAPAGSGKTALVSSYVAQRKLPAIWYRVDESDRDADDLFYYLRLAADALEKSPRAGVNLPSFSPRLDLHRFSRRFFEALFARLPNAGILVFDDHHLAPPDSPWQAAMEKAFSSIPAGKNVIVVSRRSPAPSLARFRVHGELGLLETAELLFTTEETLALAHRRLQGKKLKRTQDEILAIQTTTGGWPAGISLLLHRDGAASIPRLDVAEEVQPVFDYLADAVFSALSPEHKKLLLYTACLPNFTAVHAEKLSGMQGAGAMLSALHRSGFFLERTNEREVFRYHDLFRSFLKDCAARTLTQDELRAIRANAAKLLHGEGRGEEAFELLLETRDFPALRDLLLELAPRLFAQGRVALLERWLAALPADFFEETAWLEYWRSMCQVAMSPAESRAGFARALQAFEREANGTGAYLAWSGAVQALTYEGRAWNDVESWLYRFESLEQSCGAFASPDVGAQVAGSLVMALALAGVSSDKVESWVARALVLTESTDAPSIRVMTASALVLNYALRGDSGQTTALVARLDREARGGSAGWIASVAARGARATLAWHRGDAEAALVASREGLAIMGKRRVPMWESALLVSGGFAALEASDPGQAREFLERLAQIAEGGTPLEVAAYHVVRAQEALLRGDLSTAAVAAELSLDRVRAVGFPYGQGQDLQIIAYVALEQGQLDRVRESLDAMKELEREQRSPVLSYWRLLIDADWALREGRREAAAELLQKAFSVGRETHLFAALCPTGARLAGLCRFALEHGIEPEYTRTLIRRRRVRLDPPPVEAVDWPWEIRIRTFARVEIAIDDQPPRAVSGRMLALLLKAIALLGAGGRAVPSTALASMLWPDSDGDAAAQVFSVTLLRLRKYLGTYGHRVIRLDRGQIVLDRSICWNDVDALHELTQKMTSNEGSAAAATKQHLRSCVKRILDLCPGAFATPGELPPELRAVEERARCRAASVLRQMCEGLERLGDSAFAEESYVHALEADICPETVLAPALRCMLRAGRAQEARALLRIYRGRGVDSDEAESVVASMRA
jgi:LuxR family transcriptional regulator, maltose regulon positive regulatory protein